MMKNSWSPSAVNYVLKNERYCGDVLMQKTVCIDIFTHKSVPNRGLEPQYRIEQYHEPIIEKSIWEEVQLLLQNRRDSEALVTFGRTEPNGPLRGFQEILIQKGEKNHA